MSHKNKLDLLTVIAEKMTQIKIPLQAQAFAKLGVSDYLAVTLAILFNPLLDKDFGKLQQIYPNQSAENLAILLGYAGHALDFDDFHANMRGHPSTVILPALFALSNTETTSDFLDAYIVGVEVAGLLGKILMPSHYEMGYHSTATIGTIAATAAICYLKKSSKSIFMNALSIAATKAAGLRAQFGSSIKPLHAGFSAQNAVQSFKLAASGFEAQHNALNAFIETHTLNASIPQEIHFAQSLTELQIATPGLELKLYPTCAATHSAALATKNLRTQTFHYLNLDPSNKTEQIIQHIQSIDVWFPKNADLAAYVNIPKNGIEARFSLEYVIACMLLKGELNLVDFQDQLNEDISQLALKVTRHIDTTVPEDGLNRANRFHEIILYFEDGYQIQQRCYRQNVLDEGVNLSTKWQACISDNAPVESKALNQLVLLNQESDILNILSILKKFAQAS